MMIDNGIMLEDLIRRYPILDCCRKQIELSYEILVDCLEAGGSVFVAGNGGSAADSDHIVGELQKGFILRRPLSETDKNTLLELDGENGRYLADHLQYGLPAFSLMSQSALSSAVTNDLGGDLGPSQSLMALGRENDVFIGISTSGNSRNIALACQVAALKNIHVIGMTGKNGGKLGNISEVCIMVPETETYKVQELHLPVYHTLCMMLEKHFFG